MVRTLKSLIHKEVRFLNKILENEVFQSEKPFL